MAASRGYLCVAGMPLSLRGFNGRYYWTKSDGALSFEWRRPAHVYLGFAIPPTRVRYDGYGSWVLETTDASETVLFRGPPCQPPPASSPLGDWGAGAPLVGTGGLRMWWRSNGALVTAAVLALLGAAALLARDLPATALLGMLAVSLLYVVL